MERKEVTFNANNWTGTIHTVQYLILENETIEFRFKDHDFKIVFTTEKEEGSRFTLISGECYDDYSSEHAIVGVSKLIYSGPKRWPSINSCWTATDDGFGEGITRDHTDPVAAVCQILSNIM